MSDVGEWRIQVPMKLAAKVVERLDSDVVRFSPFCEGRSTVARVLVELAYAAIDKGILRWDLQAIQDVLSNSRNGQGLPSGQSVPGLLEVTAEHEGQPWSQVKARNKK